MTDEFRTNRKTRKVFPTRPPSGQDDLSDIPQPIFPSGDEAGTLPAVEPYDPDKEAELAEGYYEDAIRNSPSQEEVLGWEQDISEDARLTHGERARLVKIAEDQRNLLRISGLDFGEGVRGEARKVREAMGRGDKKEEEDDDKPQPIFGNDPLL
jgi:hypothetical protein